jgi:hypothetical protein
MAAVGWAFSATLAILFIIALLLGVLVPLRHAQGLVAAFADAAQTAAPFTLDSVVAILAAAAAMMGAAVAYLRVIMR